MKANPEYTGDDPPKNDTAIMQYFDKASALKLAVEQGDVDVAYRSLSPTDLEDLADADGVSIVEGVGTEIRYLGFNLDIQAGDDDAQKKAIRQAVAYSIDRQAIADNVYNGTVEPLYSMVPQGVKYATKAFQDHYGRGARRGRRQEDARRRRGEDTRAARDLVDADPLRTRVGRRVRRDQAPARRQRPVRRDAEVDRVEPVLRGGGDRQVPAVPARLVPGLSGRRRLRRRPSTHRTATSNDHYSNPEMEKLLADEKASTDDATPAEGLRRRSRRSAPRTRRRSRSGRASRWPPSATT